MTQLIVLIFLVVLGSAFFSGLEAALFAVPVSRARVLAEKKRHGAHALSVIKDSMGRSIVVIAMFNNIVNIAGSLLIGVLSTHLFESIVVGVISAVLTLLIIVFGEIVPKTIGENNAEFISLMFAPILLGATKILSPIIFVLESMTKPFMKKKRVVSEEDLHVLSDLGHKEGSIEEDEKNIIQNVFRLNDLRAKDIMTPRKMMMCFQADMNLSDIQKDLYALVHSRIPVYEKTVDDIVGVCHRRMLLTALAKDEQHKTVRDFMRPALIVEETKKVDVLLLLFQKERQHLAVVKDEFGGTSGLVTLEDVLEELVGEIVDETDKYVDARAVAKERFEQDK